MSDKGFFATMKDFAVSAFSALKDVWNKYFGGEDEKEKEDKQDSVDKQATEQKQDESQTTDPEQKTDEVAKTQLPYSDSEYRIFCSSMSQMQDGMDIMKNEQAYDNANSGKIQSASAYEAFKNGKKNAVLDHKHSIMYSDEKYANLTEAEKKAIAEKEAAMMTRYMSEMVLKDAESVESTMSMKWKSEHLEEYRKMKEANGTYQSDAWSAEEAAIRNWKNSHTKSPFFTDSEYDRMPPAMQAAVPAVSGAITRVYNDYSEQKKQGVLDKAVNSFKDYFMPLVEPEMEE